MLLNNNLYKIKDIYYTAFWKCLILWRRLPNSTSLCWNLILGRLCGMTLYEILSLAINLAILILTALSYLKDRKS